MASTHSSIALDPETALMLRVQAGDAAAFSELVTLYQSRLVAVLHHLTGSAPEAEDLAQETFLRVYRNRGDYQPGGKFSTWLFTIANHLALNSRRDQSRRPPRAQGAAAGLARSGPWPAGQTAPAKSPAPDDRLRRAELARAVRAALDTLPERQRMAVVLNKFEEMPYAEIAAVMDLTPMAVKSLLARAREQLRIALQDFADPERES